MDSVNQQLLKQTPAQTTPALLPYRKTSDVKQPETDSIPSDKVDIGQSNITSSSSSCTLNFSSLVPDEKPFMLSYDGQTYTGNAKPADDKELTVMFYMNGQYQDIGGATSEALLGMEKAGTNKNMNVVAQLGRSEYKPMSAEEFHVPLDNDWAGVRRYEVRQDSHAKLDISPEEWQKMQESHPDNPLLNYILGDIHWYSNDKEGGLKYYAKAKESGMIEYMQNYDSERSRQVRSEFETLTRPYEEAAAPFKNFSSEVKEILPDKTKMGDSATLQNFVEWGLSKYPAKHYMLVVMGHGGAWIGAADMSPSDMASAITKGTDSANTQTGRKDKIDVLAFNSCYMGNVEALTEMKDAASVTVASENYARTGIFGHWSSFLEAMSKDIEQGKPFEGKQFAKELVEFYRTQGKDIKQNFPEFSDWKESYLTLTAVDNSKLDQLAGSFGAFVKSVNQSKVPDNVLFRDVKGAKNYDSNAHNPSEVFGFYDTIRDLGSFMSNVKANPDMPIAVKAAADKVLSDMKEVIITEQHEGKNMEGSQGLTFWGPANATDIGFMNERYGDDTGKFAKSTGWSDKLKSAAMSVPQKTMKNFLETVARINDLRQKLADEALPAEDKAKLMAKLEQESTQAVDYKNQLDLTIPRNQEHKGILSLFKKSFVAGETETQSVDETTLKFAADLGKSFSEDLHTRDGME
ncbi:MAG: clostripain-related cysteine peptidase [Firmicutes bacterium]|nr:clostripain-related cysteine peptidase [Bacillota bacterium]